MMRTEKLRNDGSSDATCINHLLEINIRRPWLLIEVKKLANSHDKFTCTELKSNVSSPRVDPTAWIPAFWDYMS